MTQLQLKRYLISTIPFCPSCGCKMVVSPDHLSKNGCSLSHSAVVIRNEARENGLICFQCHRIEIKRRELERLSWDIRWRKKIDSITGIFSIIKKWKRRIHNWIYFNIKRGQRSIVTNKSRKQSLT